MREQLGRLPAAIALAAAIYTGYSAYDSSSQAHKCEWRVSPYTPQQCQDFNNTEPAQLVLTVILLLASAGLAFGDDSEYPRSSGNFPDGGNYPSGSDQSNRCGG